MNKTDKKKTKKDIEKKRRKLRELKEKKKKLLSEYLALIHKQTEYKTRVYIS